MEGGCLNAKRQTSAAEREGDSPGARRAARGQAARAARVAALEAERAALETTLAESRRERDECARRMQAEVDVARAERDALAEEIGGLKRLTAERERMLTWVEQVDREMAAANERAGELAGRVKTLNEMNTRLSLERAELHARLEAASRSDWATGEGPSADAVAQQRISDLEDELVRIKAEHATRTGDVAQVDALHGRLEESERVRRELEADLRRALEELAVADEDRADAVTERDCLEAMVGGEEAATVRAQREARVLLERRVEELSRENRRLLAEAAAPTAESAELTPDEGEFQQELDTAMRELDGLQEQLHAVRNDLSQAVAENTELRAELERLRRTESESGAQVGRDVAEIKALRNLRKDLVARVAEVEEETAQLRTQLADQSKHIAHWQEVTEQMYAADRERLSQALAEKDFLVQAMEERLAHLRAPEDTEGAAASPPPVTPDPAVADTADVASLVLFDDTEVGAAAGKALSESGFALSILASTVDPTVQIRDRPVAAVAVNLAMPSAWETARALRRVPGTAESALFAYALGPDATRGFWFGSVDFYVHEMDGEGPVKAVRRLAPGVKRVMVMSNDVDALGGVKAALKQARISTTFVLDTRQTVEMVPITRPEVVVVHLSPHCFDVFRAVGGLRGLEASRDIPILFVLDAGATQGDVAFFTAGIRLLSERGSLEAEELEARLAQVFAPHRGG